MKTIVRKTLVLETKRHDFENEYAYLEVWSNAQLKDCYFASKDFLFPDGSIKNGGRKYFYSKYTGEDVEKEIKALNYENFNAFEKLYYYDEDGNVLRYDGILASDLEPEMITHD